jgi:3-oxoadipate enol-lactonase
MRWGRCARYADAMPHTLHRGCRLFWERDGQPGAPTLLLVRGLSRSGRYWGELRERLGRSFHLLVTDNRGCGRSDAPWPPYSTALMADDHAAILDAAGVAQAHVFGISLGGMIAQEVGIRHAGRVKRLILGCTTPGGANAVQFPRGGLLGILRAALSSPDRAMRGIAPRLLSPETLRDRPEIVEQWIAIARDEPKRRLGLLGQLIAAGRHDAWEDLPGITLPTLVVTGDADRVIAPGNSRLLADRIPGARLHVIAGAGHDLPADRPEAMTTLITEFFLAPSR